MKRSEVPLILQNELAECGLACVAMISGYYGRHTDLVSLRRIIDPSARGSSMKDLAALGETLGFNVRSLKLGPRQMDRLRLPAVLHWDLVHYVVLVRRVGSEFLIHDPALGRRTIDEADFSRSFTGIAQEFVPKHNFVQTDERVSVPFRWLLSADESYWRLVGAIFLMSLVLQALVMLVPFAAQLLIDRLASFSDGWSLAFALGVGITGLGLYSALLWSRSIIAIYFSNCLDAAGSEKLIAKMLRLPYDFFARRDIGSLLTRFANLREIRLLLTQGLAESFVEALLAVLVLFLVVVYLPTVAFVGAACSFIYVLFRLGTRRTQQERVTEFFFMMGAQNASLIETLQKMETIKANSLELARQGFWSSRYLEYQNSLTLKLKMEASQRIAQILCFGFGYVVSTWFICQALFAGSLSVGEALTVLLLLGIFFARTSQFLDRFFELLVARVHLDGLAEVVHAEAEIPEHDYVAPIGLGLIELRNVGFRYSTKEPFIFRGVSLTVSPGRFVALTGPSGCGKSTLLSLILGLRAASEGQILIDGKPIESLDRRALRSRVGSVLQSDRLFYGSILENVTLFELDPPLQKFWEVLDACDLRSVVQRLPMREYTALSDASTLSGGEVQRLLLARALYKQPELLLLDEASSHLDEATEARVNVGLRESGATRVVVAHRRQTIELADVVIEMGYDESLGCTSIIGVRNAKSPGDQAAIPS